MRFDSLQAYIKHCDSMKAPALFQGLFQNMLEQEVGSRADANETLMFSRQLEYIYTRTYDVRYPENKGRLVMPVNSEVPTGAEEDTYRQYDSVGEARLIANYGDDLPKVDAYGKEFKNKIHSMGTSYSYSIQDLRRAQYTGQPIEMWKAMAARRAIENKIDQMACLGDSAVSTTGIANAPNVPLLTKTSTAWTTGTAAADIFADFAKLGKSVYDTTLGIYTADTVLIPLAADSYISSTLFVGTGFSQQSIKQWILAANPWIKRIEAWNRLGTAGAGGVSRAIAFKSDPEVLHLVIPQEFEQFAPQQKNLAFDVPCHARCGGVRVFYPKAMAYMDGV